MRNKYVIAGAVGSGILVLACWMVSESRFESNWRDVRSGMNQESVKRTIGIPSRTGHSEWVGAGNQHALRWEYDRGNHTYYIDFDSSGPHEVPLVFRTEVVQSGRRLDWPSWWPWRRARAKA